MFRVERHGLGFMKFALELFGYKIRLHIWHKNMTPSRNRHDHGWSFVSLPIWGKFIEQRWIIIPGTPNSKRHTWSTKDKADATPHVTNHDDRLELVWSHIRKPFRPYKCHAGQIHNYYPDNNGLHISLVFVGKVKSHISHIWPMNEGV